MRKTIRQPSIRDEFREAALAAWNDYQTTGLYLAEEEADAWLTKLALGEDTEAPECHV